MNTEQQENVDMPPAGNLSISFGDKSTEKEVSQSTTQSSANSKNLKIGGLLSLMIARDASDLHLSEGNKVGFRMDGKMTFVANFPALSKENFDSILAALMYENKHRIDEFYKNCDVDFGYVHDDGTPFRVNAFFKRGKPSLVLRKINRKPSTIDELGLPEAVKKFVVAKQGLVLVTGPTGSGKSTTLTAVINEINQCRSEHILTIEDPIEFIFESKKSLISQREIGPDTKNFSAALRAAMREDPDIVMIGEMRDEETVTSAVNLAETGHLVFSTLHTSGASQTIARLANFFPPDQHAQVLSRIADNLYGVISQRLVKRRDTDGRIGVYELMLANSAIRNLIRTGDMVQIDNTIKTSRESGMISMERYADGLIEKKIITKEDVKGFWKEE